MLCEFCSDSKNIKTFKKFLDDMDFKASYCPICGEKIYIYPYDKLFEFFEAASKALNIKMEYVTVDGELLLLDRKPSKKENPVKVISHPIEMKVDLDNINIDREMEMLKKLDEENKKEQETKEARSILIKYFNEIFGVE